MAYSTEPKRARRPVTTYSAAHDLVKATKGTPANHECITCGEAAQEWALMPGSPDETFQTYGPHANKRFSPNPEDYQPMCRSDHRRMDAQYRAARKAA
jgi:hypothetical protein